MKQPVSWNVNRVLNVAQIKITTTIFPTFSRGDLMFNLYLPVILGGFPTQIPAVWTEALTSSHDIRHEANFAVIGFERVGEMDRT